jgi:dephospho-CoA kinase
MGPGGTQATTRILGLTGPIGCGKTTVGNILLELGATERIDADRVVHALMAPGTETTRQVESAFGAELLTADGAVDRARLAEKVFGNDTELRRLESIVHPAVRRHIKERLSEFDSTGSTVIVDAVRLLQSDLLPLVEQVWVVHCRPEVELARLTAARGMPAQAARARMAAQPQFDHPRVALVIDNSGTPEQLRTQVEPAWSQFLWGNAR